MLSDDFLSSAKKKPLTRWRKRKELNQCSFLFVPRMMIYIYYYWYTYNIYYHICSAIFQVQCCCSTKNIVTLIEFQLQAPPPFACSVGRLSILNRLIYIWNKKRLVGHFKKLTPYNWFLRIGYFWSEICDPKLQIQSWTITYFADFNFLTTL